MAGQGYKAFTRERLTSADFQGYAVDQSVMVFTSASQRAAKLPAPADGMRSYLLDVKRQEVFDAGKGTWICREALGLVDRGALAATGATDGTTNEIRIAGALTRNLDLTPGRAYRVVCKGRGYAAATPVRCVLNVRARKGGTPVNTDPVLASDSLVFSNAGVSGAQDMQAEGLFQVGSAGLYQIGAFIATSGSTFSFTADGRGVSDMTTYDEGPAGVGLISIG